MSPRRAAKADEAPPPKLRFGVIGAAKIVPGALLRPATEVDDVEVTAVAARDPARAAAFAQKYRLPRVFRSYSELVADPDIDAVYVPLPNSFHAEWTLKAIRAGKHVLCEKPFTSNADEAKEIVKQARLAKRVASEGFAYRYHPLLRRIREILESGVIGKILRIEAEFSYANPMTNNIRFNLALSGGATMDAGCYPVSLVRAIAGQEPTVVSAHAKLLSPQIDRRMTAELSFPGGVGGSVTCAMLSRTLFRSRLVVTGETGRLRVINPYHPHWFHSITIRSSDGIRREQVEKVDAFALQLRAFAAAVRTGGTLSTDATDALANMRVIDEIYRKAGLEPRGSAPHEVRT